MSKLKISISLMAVATLVSSSVFAEGELTFSSTAGLEYDDNISVTALDQSTDESDVAAVFDFSASYSPIKIAKFRQTV